jgi:hypothetical protein
MRRAAVAVAALAAVTACTARTETIAVTQSADVAPLRVLAEAVAAPPPATLQLPRGGRTIFPRYTVVAHYGTAGTGALGVLGEGRPEDAGPRLLAAAAPFAAASGRPVLPAMELISTIAQRAAGPDRMYSTYIPDADVARYLAEARKVKALVILDLQPGRADFLDQAKHFEKFLAEPDVGLAIDPEWKLTPTQKPLGQIGASHAASINRLSAWLAKLTQDRGLPEKLFMVHQFRAFQIPDRDEVVARPGLATVLHADGFGTQRVKKQVYDVLSYKTGPIHNALKLFIDEDTNMMTPAEAMAVRPRPELITYQ